MKITKIIQLGFFLILSLGIVLSGCKKEEDTPEPDPNNGSSSVQQLSQDENFEQKVSDDIMNDVEGMLSSGSQRSVEWLPCNATIDSANVVNDTITYFITYNGLNCMKTLYRTGKVEVKSKFGQSWHEVGATVIVSIINYQVTNVYTGESAVVNGVKTHTNVTGGYIVQLGYGLSEVIHKTSGFITINFDNSTNRTWNVARRKVFTGMLGDFTVAVSGFGQAGSYSNLETWGVTRAGDQFYISIPQSIEVKESCGWDPVAGIEIIDIPSASTGATLTFGFDNNNQPIQPGDCPAKYKLDWYVGGSSGTIFLWL